MAEQTINIVTQKNKLNKKRKAEVIFMISMLAIPLLHFLFFWLFINFNSLNMSFQRYNMSSGQYVWNGLKNYTDFFRELGTEYSVLPTAIKNSFTLFLWNDFLIVPVSLLCAFILFKGVPMSNFYKVIFFFPSIISAVILTLSFSFMFDSTFGIINKALESVGLGDIIPWEGWFGTQKTAFPMILLYGLWTGIGYNVVLITGAITRIPREIFEAGELDGLTVFKELFYIVIPMIGTTLSTLLLLGTTVIFTYFLQPMLLTGANSANVGTYTIALFIVNNVRDDGNYTLGATVGILCALVGTPLVLFSRKILEKVFPAYEY